MPSSSPFWVGRIQVLARHSAEEAISAEVVAVGDRESVLVFLLRICCLRDLCASRFLICGYRARSCMPQRMDEVWERAVEAALEGQPESAAAPRILTLDGAVKCLHGRLPPPALLERFQSLQHLSIANVGVSSLEKFPRLRNLQRLILSDNRIAGGLEFLVEAGLDSLRDLDLSNNRIQFLEDLAPLARLRLVSLDLYECPVTRIKDYRSRVFGLIRSLKYLDKMDADENERPETDEEEEDDEEEDEDDPGSGEIEGEDRARKAVNGGAATSERGGVLDVDEDDESDADEEPEIGGRPKTNGYARDLSNGFHVATSGSGHEEDEESEELDEEEYVEDYDEEDLGGEINQEEADEDVLEVHEIDNSEEEDGVEEDDDDEEDDEEDDEDEEDDGSRRAGISGRLASLEGEIDGDELAEEDENGEIGEYDEPGVDEDHESDDDDDDGEDEVISCAVHSFLLRFPLRIIP